MEDKKPYSIYWRQFDDYRGEGMLDSNYNPTSVSVLKTGYEQTGKDRVKINANLELEPENEKWVNVWGNISLIRKVDFYCTVQRIIEIEKRVQHAINPDTGKKFYGKKMFYIPEKVSGITEFRLNTINRRDYLEIVFDNLEKYPEVVNKVVS
jgi:hypothetical protein